MENQIRHIGVILDGNRRYAKSKNLPSYRGHEFGAEKLEDFLKWCRESNIFEVSLYALSIENLKREPKELEYLFNLFRKFFKKFKDNKEIKNEKVKISFIGDLSLVPEDIRQLANQLEEETKENSQYKVNFCFAYGGRLELVHAFNKLAKENKKDITEEDITNSLWLKSSPEVIIRTGGNYRTSNFLPWQSIYSEWFFLDKMWPEITKQDLETCLEKFKLIKRNFGK